MIQTKFLISGTNVRVAQLDDSTALDYLPPKIYVVQYDQFSGFYLSTVKDELTLPPKIYGIATRRADRVIQTYKQRATSTGILMTGHKGTGKSLLMGVLANKVVTELKLPVLLIKEAYHGEQFTSFIESIGESCMLFDEFGKMYGVDRYRNDEDTKPKQNTLLSLMDGIDKTKRLLILTENDEHDISDLLLNRPSRVYYHFRYAKLDEDSIMEYCEDMDVSTTVIDEIIGLSRTSRIFSFDMLQTLVEEHLRFGEPIDQITKELNIDLSKEFIEYMEVLKVIHKNTKEEIPIVGDKMVPRPGRGVGYVQLGIDYPEFMDEDDTYYSLDFGLGQQKFESPTKIVFEVGDIIVTAKPAVTKVYDYNAF